MANYDEMTLEQLETENTRLGNQRDTIRAEQKVIAQVMDRKRAEALTRARVASMGPAEREAMAQALAGAKPA